MSWSVLAILILPSVCGKIRSVPTPKPGHMMLWAMQSVAHRGKEKGYIST